MPFNTCRFCGESEVPIHADFCIACGQPIHSTPQSELNLLSIPTSNNRLKYIFGGILVVSLSLFLLVYFQGKVRVEQTNATATANEHEAFVKAMADLDKTDKILTTKDALLKMPVKNSIAIGPLTMTFGPFVQAKEFEFGRYRGESHMRTAERGEKYLTANVDIASKDKNPSFPCLYLFKYSNGGLYSLGTFYYEFYRWESFATYLGNYHDNSNDFAYTEKIKFSVGVAEDEETLRNNAILVLLKRENIISRSEEESREPPVRYAGYECIGSTENSLDKYEVVTIMNKEKLR